MATRVFTRYLWYPVLQSRAFTTNEAVRSGLLKLERGGRGATNVRSCVARYMSTDVDVEERMQKPKKFKKPKREISALERRLMNLSEQEVDFTSESSERDVDWSTDEDDSRRFAKVNSNHVPVSMERVRARNIGSFDVDFLHETKSARPRAGRPAQKPWKQDYGSSWRQDRWRDEDDEPSPWQQRRRQPRRWEDGESNYGDDEPAPWQQRRRQPRRWEHGISDHGDDEAVLPWEQSPRQQRNENRQLKFAPAVGNEFLFGIAPCLLALQQGQRSFSQLFLKDAPYQTGADRIEEIESLADEKEVKVVRIPKHRMTKMIGDGTHQGVCLEATKRRAEPLSLEDISPTVDVDSERPPIWLVLNEVQDPMNFGAILRSSYYLGVDKIIASSSNCCPLTPVVSKASSGAMETQTVYSMEDIPALLQNLSSSGWTVVGTVAATEDVEGTVVCGNFALSGPTVLVLGNEGHGLGTELENLCTTKVTIQPGRELHPGIDSLNVSVATGILLHSILSNRK
ncbi:rRNA methyltransferase 1, mitochondrial-like [Branchiostoma floridae]|uniref:rRNA methyltransferase 1, mitochondrial n=1 Tax=Branchiostoma floridae TaxID=7739 RepID=A0A9J7M010_BRAFL|nr:rRNA methyltransferase 1, mitochondrial-like [Branchiostoma floridae]